jgi:hypothetical protein
VLPDEVVWRILRLTLEPAACDAGQGVYNTANKYSTDVESTNREQRASVWAVIIEGSRARSRLSALFT